MWIQNDTVNPVVPFRNVENVIQGGCHLGRYLFQQRIQSLMLLATCKFVDITTVCERIYLTEVTYEASITRSKFPQREMKQPYSYMNLCAGDSAPRPASAILLSIQK